MPQSFLGINSYGIVSGKQPISSPVQVGGALSSTGSTFSQSLNINRICTCYSSPHAFDDDIKMLYSVSISAEIRTSGIRNLSLVCQSNHRGAAAKIGN